MSAICGSGASERLASREAAIEATQQALTQLNGARATFGFVFASPGRDLALILRCAREVADGAEILGCSTAGEITERGVIHGGVVVLLVSADARCSSKLAVGLRDHPERVADELWLHGDELRKSGFSRDGGHLTTVLLVGGMTGSGERLVLDLYDRGHGASRIVGGAAGDEGKFDATCVGTSAGVDKDAAAALHVLGRSPWGMGVNHGMRSTTKEMLVTRAEGNIVYELDGEPAIAPYVRHASARGFSLSTANAAPYLLGNELGVHRLGKIARVCAPFAARGDGSLSCASEVPEGSMVSIMHGEPATMIEAASAAALEAKRGLGDRTAGAVLLFDCVCRANILKGDFEREVAAVRSVFGDVPLAGFLTFGEIACYGDSPGGWHNATAVVAAIPQ